MPIITNWIQPVYTKKIGDYETHEFVFKMLQQVHVIAENDTRDDEHIDVISKAYTTDDKAENLGSIIKDGGSELLVTFSEDFLGPADGECNGCKLEKYYRFCFTVLKSNSKQGRTYFGRTLLRQVVDYYRQNIACSKDCITIKIKEGCFIEYNPKCSDFDRAIYTDENESLGNPNYLTAHFRAKVRFNWGNESNI